MGAFPPGNRRCYTPLTMNTSSSPSRFPVRVLVFPCGSELGLALHRALAFTPHVELHGASSVACNHGPFVYKRYTDGLPRVDEPGFLDAVNALVRRDAIDFVFPANDPALLAFIRNLDLLECDVIAPPLETCEGCRVKSRTYERLGRHLPVPEVLDPDGELDYPVFVKPDYGRASRGARLVRSPHDLRVAREDSADLIVMAYLPGDEYTVDCFTDRHGRVRFAGGRVRERTAGGISVHTRPASLPRFREMAEIINEHLPMRGAWFYQVREDRDGVLTLLEVAPRVSGATGLYRARGVNLPLLSIYDRLGMDVEILEQDVPAAMDAALINRFDLGIAYSRVYLDLDDTLILNGQVNPWALAFVYQCRNAGVDVHLLTRHADHPEATLARLAIGPVFASVRQVGDAESKADFIDSEGAIFIDDSHAERRDVRARCGIPVFAPDALEALLDWRR